MGCSPDASIAWGIALDPAEEYEEKLDEIISSACGWTETDHESEGFLERHKAAVPIGYSSWGDCCNGEAGLVLVINRTCTTVNYSWEALDTSTLNPPDPEELGKLSNVLDALGFPGDRQVRLILFASYG